MALPQFDMASDLNQAQLRIKRVFNTLLRVPLLDGRLISGIQLSAGVQTPVAHGLGRLPLGYLVVGRDAALVPFEPATRDELYLYLESAVGGSLSLWVF
jgi:hypothetical protein